MSNTTSTSLPATCDITPVPIECTRPGCMNFHGEPRIEDVREAVEHRAFRTQLDAGSLIECIAWADEPWHVAGFLRDDDRPLTRDRFELFTAAWTKAQDLADSLNTGEPTA